MVSIELPEDVLLTTGQSREDFVREAKPLLAMKLFELGRLSSGKSAQLSGMARVDFLLAASQAGVPVADLDSQEIERELLDA